MFGKVWVKGEFCLSGSLLKSRTRVAAVLVLSSVLIVCVIGAVHLGGLVEVARLDLPVHVHLTWEGDPSSAITVTWQTRRSVSGDVVLFDDISRGGDSGLYACSAVGINHTYAGASGIVHDVELTGLSPDRVYYFVCGGDAGGWSDERAFRTAPLSASDVRFVVGGDSRTNHAERDKVSRAMAEFNPVFVVHVGDLINDSTVQSDWDSWFTDVNDHWVGDNGLTIPVIPVLGNHESPNSVDSKFFHQFVLPGNERWYSYDWGPDIHIVVLDCYPYDGWAECDWLEADLAAHADCLWKIVVFHEPPFVSGHHDPWVPGLLYWVPLFDKYHVDVVFSGHEHNYQRSYPLNWSASQSEIQDYSNGTMYVISGAWGAPLYTPTPAWFMAYQDEMHHFCLVDIYRNGTLHLQAKDNLGVTFDEVRINKGNIGGSSSN